MTLEIPIFISKYKIVWIMKTAKKSFMVILTTALSLCFWNCEQDQEMPINIQENKLKGNYLTI